jgi:putative transposase
LGSRSVRTTEKGGPRGYDGAKKVNGLERHLLVGTGGLVMKAKEVHPADLLADREGATMVLGRVGESFPGLRHLWADARYRGADLLRRWITEGLGLSLEIVQRKPRWVRVLATMWSPSPYRRAWR